MRRWPVFFGVAALLSISSGSAYAGDSSVTAEIIGIRVIDGAFPADEFEFLPFQGDTGTQLMVMLTSGDKQFVELLHRESKVTALTGGERHDLLEKREKQDATRFAFGNSPVSAFAKFSKDRKRAVVEINAPQAPAVGDTYLRIKGQLVAKVARGTQRVVRENVALKPGPIKVDDYQVVITGASKKKGFSGEDRFTVQIRYSGKAGEALESLQFIGPDGNEIKVEGRFWSSVAGVTTVSYPLKRQVARAKLVFTFWKDPETVTVPLDLKQTLGMGSGT